MTDIPYNYRKYMDDVTKMTQRGAISSGEQEASPSSAGSRGLAKTMQFTKNPTQMKLGQSEGQTQMAESMMDIRSILNRIDGVNVPVKEDEDKDVEKAKQIAKNKAGDMTGASQDIDTVKKGLSKHPDVADALKTANEDLDYRSEDILNKAGFDPADIDTYMKVFNDHGDTSDLEQMNMKEKVGLAEVMSMVLASHGIQNESYQPFPEADEFNIEEDEDFEEVLGPLGFPEDETELFDAEYRGRKVPLNKPMRGDVKKFKVYVKDPKTGNVKKVNFGHGGTSAKRPTMRIRKSNPKARKSFRARHNCANPGPKTKARYWSCRKW